MNYKTSRRLFNILLYIASLVCVASVLLEKHWIGVIGIVLLLADAVQVSVFYRCPHCHAALPVRGKAPKHCPECGAELD